MVQKIFGHHRWRALWKVNKYGTIIRSICYVCSRKRHYCTMYNGKHTTTKCVVERRNCTLTDMVKSMISSFNIHISLWNGALKTIVYILNKVPLNLFLKLILNYRMDGNQI